MTRSVSCPFHPAAHLGEEIGWGIEIWPVDRLVR
jgi:hypothetical protein